MASLDILLEEQFVSRDIDATQAGLTSGHQVRVQSPAPGSSFFTDISVLSVVYRECLLGTKTDITYLGEGRLQVLES